MESFKQKGNTILYRLNLYISCVDNRLKGGHGSKDINKDVTAVVQAEMLVA